MPTARSDKTSAHSAADLVLPKDPGRAAAMRAGWAWKEQWREAMTRIPFDQKLAILRRMWEDERLHPRRLG